MTWSHIPWRRTGTSEVIIALSLLMDLGNHRIKVGGAVIEVRWSACFASIRSASQSVMRTEGVVFDVGRGKHSVCEKTID